MENCLCFCFTCPWQMYRAFKDRRQRRREREKNRHTQHVLMHLPFGTDSKGNDLVVEVYQIGMKEALGPHMRDKNVVPVTITHNKDGMIVSWGTSSSQMYARLGRTYVRSVRVINHSIGNVLDDQADRPFIQVHGGSQTQPAAAGKTDAAALAAATAAASNTASVKAVTDTACKRVEVPPPVNSSGMEAHLDGALYELDGTLPNERGSFRILSDDVVKIDGVETPRQRTWWVSTIWHCPKAKRKGDFVIVARHTIIALKMALDSGKDLRVVTEHSGKDVGRYGSEARSSFLPAFDLSTAVCLADALPKDLVKAYYKALQTNKAPIDPAILYDVVLIPCKWNMSQANLKTMKADWTSVIGKSVRMRAVDFYNEDRNGITCGVIPESPENRNRSKRFGFVISGASNSHGGSSSIGYVGEQPAFMHLGRYDDVNNYGVSGAVVRQLINYWCGRPPCDTTDTGFQRFVKATKSNIAKCEQVMEKFPPELVGNTPTDTFVDMFVDALLPKDQLVPSSMEAPDVKAKAAPKSTGSKASNQRTHAIAKAGGAAGLKQLAKRDYNKARSLVRAFKVSTQADASVMAMLYYWLDGGDDEEYDWKYTTKQEREWDELKQRAEEEFEEFVQYAFYGDQEGHWDHEDDDWEAPFPLKKLCKAKGTAEAGTSGETENPKPALNSELHCGISIRQPQSMTPHAGGVIWTPQSRSSMESPNKELTITQVAEEHLQAMAYKYATEIKDCIQAIEASEAEVKAFDDLLDSCLGDDPEKLKTVTKRQFFDACAKLRVRGSLSGSRYWNRYIAPNILPAAAVKGATKIKNLTAKAPTTYNGGITELKEPTFEGLFKLFPHWNWDHEENEAKGVLPPQGPAAVAESLQNTLQENKDALPLDPRSVPALASGYPAVVLDMEEDMYSFIKRNMEELVMSKGVGWDLCGYSSKRAFCESMHSVPTVLTKLALVLVTDLEYMANLDPWSLYQLGLIMPEILKIKNEATKRKKARQKRWRVIWQTCITQELLCRLIHGDQNVAETAAYQCGYTHSDEFPTFGNCPGLGHHNRGLQHTKEALRRLIGDDVGCAADRKSWDLSVTRHMWYAEGQLRAILAAAGGAPKVFQEAQLKMSMLLSAHVAQVGKTLYQVDIFGLVGSGIFSTASSNGKLNQLLAIDYPIHKLPPTQVVTYKDFEKYLSLVMGDDSVMRSGYHGMAGFVKHHAERGVTVTAASKEALPGPLSDMTKVPFTSHLYDLTSDAMAVFDNVEKLSWRLALSMKATRDQAMGVLFAVRHTEHKDEVREMLAVLDPKHRDLEYVEGAGFNLDGYL